MKIHHVLEKKMAITDSLLKINSLSVYTVLEDTAEFSLSAFSVEGVIIKSTTAGDTIDKL